jgi:hypothetical protein
MAVATTDTRPGTAPRPGGNGADGWLRAVETLFFIPPGYRAERIKRHEALDILRCGETVLDTLIAAGLPCGGVAGAELFDRFDLFNLALASKSGTSVPERAIRYALRWMHGGPDSWTQRIEWNFSTELACPLPECGADPEWSHARPAPELMGGELTAWDAAPAAHVGTERVEFRGPGPARMSGRLVTRGELATLRSPRLVSIVNDFLDAPYLWVRMPERLQWDYERVLAAGVAPCISASLLLQRQFEAAGHPAQTRRGWLLGMLDLAHSWVEVVDDDGVRKVVDPIFARLVEHAAAPHPDLARAVIGSRVNRLMPAAMPADGLMVTHRCGGRDVEPDRRTVIRRSAA